MTCFIREDSQDKIPDLFLDSDKVILFTHKERMEDLAVLAGLFQSRTQARKNGWSGSIPAGWSEHGSKKNRIYIYNEEYSVHIWNHPMWELFDITDGRIIDWSYRGEI